MKNPFTLPEHRELFDNLSEQEKQEMFLQCDIWINRFNDAKSDEEKMKVFYNLGKTGNKLLNVMCFWTIGNKISDILQAREKENPITNVKC